MKWEYRKETQRDFDALGAEGWELCAFTPSGIAVFKRPLPAPLPPERESLKAFLAGLSLVGIFVIGFFVGRFLL